ncbi:TolC family protein [Chitinophaga nivalis]|uniref:TolC family protein n=2 Tax=Chitinophaga nivalis TaxID=2991709 RepID=A0ABT3IVW3_9BACT|nr:TolC family protein [Chitinophaga nivalis]MCW3462190.1 TolC family protein [Chitinophaga nivalis]MCW3488118.1 TolC family protein [Chitinophaga nivalis]
MFANITSAAAQDTWSLKRCVDYALQNSIQVKQQEVQKRLAELTLKQSQLSRLPNANGTIQGGYSDGRAASLLDNSYVNQSVFSSSGQLSADADIFGWFGKQHTIAANRLDAASNSFLLLKARNDLAFNVTTAFLKILLDKEQVKINEVNLKQTTQNLENTKKLVIAGSVPESNQADLEAQLALDSSTLVTAQNTVILSTLQLKAYMNLGFEIAFQPEIPENISDIPLAPIAEMSPEMVYSVATSTYPQLKSDELRIESATRNLKSARAGLYPKLTSYGNLYTRYANNYYIDPIKQITMPFGQQIDNTFQKDIGLSLRIPLFNGWQQRATVAKAKEEVFNRKLTRDLDNQKLKQDIYTAHANAIAALQKLSATSKGVEAAQKSYDFATKRFNIGLMNTIDYITTQSKLFKAQIDKVSAQYDYIFKMKLLEFYRDQKISL